MGRRWYLQCQINLIQGGLRSGREETLEVAGKRRDARLGVAWPRERWQPGRIGPKETCPLLGGNGGELRNVGDGERRTDLVAERIVEWRRDLISLRESA